MANGTYHTPKGHRSVQVYTPTVGFPEWHGTKLELDQKAEVRKGLRTAMVTNHEDYQTILGFMHEMHPLEMDGMVGENGRENTAIEWNYKAGLKKPNFKVHNEKLGIDQGMYAFVTYDSKRGNIPIAIGGSFFEEREIEGVRQPVGIGVVLFVSPDYRGRGFSLGEYQWMQEAALYRELGIKFQYEIQNQFSFESTKSLFKNPESIVVTSMGRKKNDGTYAQIRLYMNYNDPQLVEDWNSLPDEPVKDFMHKYDVQALLKQEGFTAEELRKPWIKREQK